MTRGDPLLWERWDDIDRVLSQALDLPADQREAFVDQATGAEPHVRALVFRLLDRMTTDAAADMCPADDLVLAALSGDDAGPDEEDLPAGTVVGRYRVVRRVGRGGMATVYEAERADGAFEQRVALKVLRRGLDTEDLIRRFLTERQILSSLTHPNIAELHDGGSTADGRPFLAMELVTGEPITQWADHRHLDVPARLDLFLAVASAVHAAHRQLVVHRDLKPSNIMVDGEGRVKLLDFGIAKMLESEDAHTRTGTSVLTPDYATPEQLRGSPITTGTDVYQLGLLLRELLTGVRPLAGDTQPGEPPLKPSRAAGMALKGAHDPGARATARRSTPRDLARLLTGDLDIIVGKALRPDPLERYASADELAADVRRYLRRQPILAHPESALYRFRKFAGRHRWLVPAVVAGQVVLLSFVTTLALQNRRIARERDAAEMASRRAEATQAFLVDFLRSADPNQAPNPDLTVVEALAHGRERMADELGDQPEVKASLLDAVGRTYTGLGRYETADTLLQESLELKRSLYGAGSLQVAGGLSFLAANQRLQSRNLQADSLWHEEFRLRTAAGLMADTTLARLLGSLSSTRREIGDLDSALALAAQAVAVLERAGHGGAYLTSALQHLAFVLRGAQLLDSAESVYREVRRRQEARAGTSPLTIALTYNNLGYLQRVREDFATAEASYREAIRLASPLLSEGHPQIRLYRNNLAAVLEHQGKLDEVEQILTENIGTLEREWPDGHWRIGGGHLGLATFLVRNGRAHDARQHLEAGIRIFGATRGDRDLWTVAAEARLGAALLLTGRAAEARQRLDRSYSILQNRTGDLDQTVRVWLDHMAISLEAGGHTAEAARFRRLLSPE